MEKLTTLLIVHGKVVKIVNFHGKAEKIFEGGMASVDTTSKTSLSAIHWLEDEDPEMANAVIQASQGNLSIANQRLQTSVSYYQRAISELQSITGALGAPEQQQRAQRQQQGATS